MFENAKFGDKFKTREGKLCIYVIKETSNKHYLAFYDEHHHTHHIQIYHSNGKYWETSDDVEERANDIVSNF